MKGAELYKLMEIGGMSEERLIEIMMQNGASSAHDARGVIAQLSGQHFPEDATLSVLRMTASYLVMSCISSQEEIPVFEEAVEKLNDMDLEPATRERLAVAIVEVARSVVRGASDLDAENKTIH